MAVFETIAIREGTPLFPGEHLRLLADAARCLLGVDPGIPDLTPPALDAVDTGVLRLYLTAGDGAPAAPVCEPRLFALFETVDTNLPDEQTARLHPGPVSPFGHGAKTANYWTHCAAQSAARAAGYDHALLADHGGLLLSAAFGNLFLVLDGRLCTPSTRLAVRPGVLRSWVMQNHRADEIEFPADRLGEAEEIFLTNSRLGVMPLRFGGVAPGPVGAALRDAVRREKLVP
jgi:branched-subunit amino acid aminotransferase/4-amino-4-deoxychorismate lyase